LAGHDHTYERLLVEGIPYIVNGLGGGAIYYFVNALPESQARYSAGHGAMLVTATESEITFSFYSVENELIDSTTVATP
jgi:predicted benzoate:H+ symporter BenE